MSRSEAVDPGIVDAIAALASGRFGIAMGERENAVLQAHIGQRASALHLSPTGYLGLLQSPSPASDTEWASLADVLTVGESYFFRDEGQFELLRRWVLPELMRARRPSLRVWSAGCSRGEEPYSVAILWQESFAECTAKPLLLLGTDISPAALRTARQARYRDWSLRRMDDERRRRWFRGGNDEWQIDERIRQMVEFRLHNLVSDDYPTGFDLILCRNVFIYLTGEVRQRVLDRLVQSLVVGGYLLTGHNELFKSRLGELTPRLLPEGLAYCRTQRAEETPKPAHPPYRRVPKPVPPRRPSPPRRPHRHPSPPAEPPAKIAAPSFAEARQLADAGRLVEAERQVKAMIDVQETDAAAHFLLGYLVSEAGRLDEARHHFRRSLYLDPGFVAAYVEIAALYERQGNRKAADRVRRAALDVLARLAEAVPIEPYEGVTAGALAKLLRERLGDQ